MDLSNNSHPWIQNLLHADVFSHPVTTLQLIETHISWIVLTGDFAYKIKKPLDLDFLDFSTLALRKHYCEKELVLNQRFSEGLYLEVVKITGSGIDPRVDGDGEVFDYALKMRQFDNDLLLDNLARQGGLSAEIIHQLAALLARLHVQLPSLEVARSMQAAEQFFTAAMQNFEQIRKYGLTADIEITLENLEEWTRSAYRKCLPTMLSRQKKGFVKDCHGDCHLGNMALIDNEVTLFDCLEFNDSLRQMDTIAESAFLSMDLCAHNLVRQSQRLLNDYLEYCGDYAGLRLLNLYRSYYALVRAKVKLMKRPVEDDLPLDDEDVAAACRYVMLAEQFTHVKQPLVVLMHGLSGSGKSWLAEQLMAVGNTIRIRSDVERKRLFGQWPAPTGTHVPDMYSKKASGATFGRLHELTGVITSAGFNCIIDATFLSRAARKPFLEWALREKLRLAIVSCSAPEGVIMERLHRREKEASDPSDANIDIYKMQKSNVEDFLPEERNCLIEADTTQSDCAESVAARLAL